MVKVLVIYDSETGNTEKMAALVAAGAREVKNVDVTVKKVDTATNEDLLAAHAIIMGSPTYYGQMSGKLKSFIDASEAIHGKLKGKVGGAFTSSGGTASGAETTLLSVLNAMLIHGMVIVGRSDNKHYGAAAVEAPEDKDKDMCKELGKRIAELTVKIHGGRS
jgi:NAD(P)H dehydrogenase (quinone)